MWFWKWNFQAADTSLVIKVWSKVLCDRIHRLPNLTIWVGFSLIFLPKVAYYATNNPNHVFPLFFLSCVKVCFHTILNKSKNIVFHVKVPPPLYLPLIDFKLQSLVELYISPPYQAAACPLAYASSIVLDNSFRKHSTIISQYIWLDLWKHGFSECLRVLC